MPELYTETRLIAAANRLKQSSKGNSNRIHIISRGNKWAVKREGMKRATRVVNTKKMAISVARSKSKSGQISNVVVHKKDGSVEKIISV